tara:strand:- start:2733 stop:2963 length:231 start_codon:yes stop_codon:yes gene_type:complete
MEQPYAIDGIYYAFSDETYNKNKRSNNSHYENNEKKKSYKEINYKNYYNLGKRINQTYKNNTISEINNSIKRQKYL